MREFYRNSSAKFFSCPETWCEMAFLLNACSVDRFAISLPAISASILARTSAGNRTLQRGEQVS